MAYVRRRNILSGADYGAFLSQGGDAPRFKVNRGAAARWKGRNAKRILLERHKRRQLALSKSIRHVKDAMYLKQGSLQRGYINKLPALHRRLAFLREKLRSVIRGGPMNPNMY